MFSRLNEIYSILWQHAEKVSAYDFTQADFSIILMFLISHITEIYGEGEGESDFLQLLLKYLKNHIFLELNRIMFTYKVYVINEVQNGIKVVSPPKQC